MYITLLHLGVVERSVKLVWVSFSNNANAHYPCGSLSTLTPYRFTLSGCAHDSVVPQAVVTDNRLGINGCHAISRLYQATLMSCGTVKHVSVDCIYIYIYRIIITKAQSENSNLSSSGVSLHSWTAVSTISLLTKVEDTVQEEKKNIKYNFTFNFSMFTTLLYRTNKLPTNSSIQLQN